MNAKLVPYHQARCAAITKAGHRCTGRWQTAFDCMFAWDPIAGVGLSGPKVVLCHRHRQWKYGKKRGVERVRIIRGWLGTIQPHSYYDTVFARRTGTRPAAWWWNNRHETRFGVAGPEVAP